MLNLAWALAIVFTDVPAGALADRVGRKPLIVAATLCMIGEMLLLLLAPQNGGLTLFLFCLANRVLSGIAEGMASGADEALVFDSLAEQDRSSDWPLVLDQVMRWHERRNGNCDVGWRRGLRSCLHESNSRDPWI